MCLRVNAVSGFGGLPQFGPGGEWLREQPTAAPPPRPL